MSASHAGLLALHKFASGFRSHLAAPTLRLLLELVRAVTTLSWIRVAL